MRVLMPQRFDVLSTSMDSNIVSQWLALEGACELVLWGPGLEGFVPGMPLDAAAERSDADVVLLGDLHHAIPDLWTALWEGAARCRVPLVWHLADQGAHLPERRAVLETIRPAAVLAGCSRGGLADYADLLARHRIAVLTVPWGFDAEQFFPPHAGGKRDIDVLIAGAEQPESVYPTRNRVKRAARRLAGEFRVIDLSHPGYWESTGIVLGRGQAQYADLLRRSRMATTGTAFGALVRKYWEAAACGAIGVGDLPADEPDSDRFAGATLAIDRSWSEDRIEAEMRQLLADEARLNRMSAAGAPSVAGCGHHERARDYVAALAEVIEDHRPRPRRPAIARPPRIVKVCAAVEPAAVPSVRVNWTDIWACGEPGQSRTRRLERAIAEAGDIAVIAFDPDAARDVDALVLATACRASGRIVLRPGGDDQRGDFAATSWGAIAAPRAELAGELVRCGGRAGIEAAVLALGRRLGWQILGPGAYVDPAGDLVRLVHGYSPRAAERSLQRAQAEGRHTTAAELAGLIALAAHGEPFPGPVAWDSDAVAQDPECPLALDGGFVPFDPRSPEAIEVLAAYASRGPGAPPLNVGVPLTTGTSVRDALGLATEGLMAHGVDVDACADLVFIERPLFTAEVKWLSERLGGDRAPISTHQVALARVDH